MSKRMKDARLNMLALSVIGPAGAKVCAELRAERQRYQGAKAYYEEMRKIKEKLALTLDEIAHPGHVLGQGDYYGGVQAGKDSAAEIANDALEAAKEGNKDG